MNIIISNNSNEPIYEQIVMQIKNAIMSGELHGQSMLPSIRSLAKELQISVITTKRAYQELENEGYISTVQGKGSYVNEKNKELLRELRIKAVEEKLNEAIEVGRTLELSFEDMQDILRVLYEEV